MENGMNVSRKALYDEIWAEPMLAVAKRYGVSSNYLARVCERMNVPRPHRGYWQKLRAGARKEPPPLPEAIAGDELEWSRARRVSR